MKFLIVGDEDFAVEQSVDRLTEAGFDVLGIVHKNWHIYGTTGDRITDRLLKVFAPYQLFDFEFGAIFIQWAGDASDDPDRNQKLLDECAGNVRRCTGFVFSDQPLFTISAFPKGSAIKCIGDSLDHIQRKMGELSGRKH